MEQKTNRKHYAIEGGKERILKVKPKGGEWGSEFRRPFLHYYMTALSSTFVSAYKAST